MQLTECQINDVEKGPVLFSIFAIKFRNLLGFNRPFLPVKLGGFSAEINFGKPAKLSENNEQDVPLFSLPAIMKLKYVDVFRPFGGVKRLLYLPRRMHVL